MSMGAIRLDSSPVTPKEVDHLVPETHTWSVADIVRRRRSGNYLTGPVERSLVQDLLETAVWAPNHHLSEPWQFVVVAEAGRERLADVWAEAAAAQVAPEHRDKVRQGERQKVYRAPVLIFVSAGPPTGNPVRDDEDYAATAAAVQNLLLLACERGLGSMWRTGKMTRTTAVKQFLGLHDDDRLVAIVYVGYEGQALPARPRDTVHHIRWLS